MMAPITEINPTDRRYDAELQMKEIPRTICVQGH